MSTLDELLALDNAPPAEDVAANTTYRCHRPAAWNWTDSNSLSSNNTLLLTPPVFVDNLIFTANA